jgi:hypothetical protein
MRNVILKTEEAVANVSRAMEFRNHFKNGANSKSHTSRENNQNSNEQ